MKKVSFYLQYLAVISVVSIFRHLPRGFFFFLGRTVSRILFLMPQMGRISMMNLAVVFPEMTKKEHKRIALKSLENLVVSLCEFFWCQGRKVPDELFDFLPETDAAAEAGHRHPLPGAIFVTPHLGNWEFAGMELALHYKFPLATIVRSPRNPWLNRLISSGRMVEGVTIVYSKGAVRGMVSALREGRSVGILIDQNTRLSQGGDFVDFFGMPVPVSMAPAHLARKANRFVAVGTMIRNGRRFRAILRPLPKEAAAYKTDRELTQAIMNITMEFIRAYPEQYLWMYRRFQNIPPSAPEEIRRRFPPYASEPRKRFFRKGTPEYEAAKERQKNSPEE